MAGQHQKRAVQHRPPLGWQMQFRAVGRYSSRVQCIVCGTEGYPGGTHPFGWQASCLLGHPDQCQACGARFVKGGLSKHLTCRSGHGACCQHTDTKFRRLQRRTP